MPELIASIEGKSATLDIYEDKAVARKPDREREIPYKQIKSIEFEIDESLEDRFIKFNIVAPHKNDWATDGTVTFHLKQHEPSEHEIKPILDELIKRSSAIRSETVQKILNTPLPFHNLNKIICPYCYSENVQVAGQNRKAFSVGKAVGGALLTGGVGLLAGFAGKKGGYDMFCLNCNRMRFCLFDHLS